MQYPDNIYYDNEVEFNSQIEYGVNGFCALDLTMDSDSTDWMAIIYKTFIVYDFCRTQSLLLFSA